MVTFKNINIKVCPMPSDIPLLETNSYDNVHDIFSILFKNSGHITQKTVDDTITFLIDTTTGYFAGIRVSGIKAQNIQTISLFIEKKLEDFVKEMQNQLPTLKKEDLFKALADLNMNNRRTGFLGELIEKEFANKI